MHFFTREGDRRSAAIDGEVTASGIASSSCLRRQRAPKLLTQRLVGQGLWALVWPLLVPRLRHHASHRSRRSLNVVPRWDTRSASESVSHAAEQDHHQVATQIVNERQVVTK